MKIVAKYLPLFINTQFLSSDGIISLNLTTSNIKLHEDFNISTLDKATLEESEGLDDFKEIFYNIEFKVYRMYFSL